MRVFEFFSIEQNLPIPLDVMAEQVLEQGLVNEIRFHAVPVPNDAVAALLYMVEYNSKGPYASNGGGGPIKIAHVIYDEDLPPRRMRLAVAKELLHICDAGLATAHTEETVDRLIDELMIPGDLAGELAQLQIATSTDKAGLIKAAACLFPYECRETLKPQYDAQLISDDYLADLTELPVPFVRLIMSDLWQEIYNTLADLDETLSCGPV